MRADTTGLNVQSGRASATKPGSPTPCRPRTPSTSPSSRSRRLVAARLTGAKKSRLHRIEGGDTGAPLAPIAELRSRALTQLGGAAEVACCFEAGRDGFWLHRLLTAHGILVYVAALWRPPQAAAARRSKSPPSPSPLSPWHELLPRHGIKLNIEKEIASELEQKAVGITLKQMLAATRPRNNPARAATVPEPTPVG